MFLFGASEYIFHLRAYHDLPLILDAAHTKWKCSKHAWNLLIRRAGATEIQTEELLLSSNTCGGFHAYKICSVEHTADAGILADALTAYTLTINAAAGTGRLTPKTIGKREITARNGAT